MHERSEMLMLVRSLLHYLNVSDVDAYRPSRRYSRRYSGGGGRAAVTLKLLLPLARSLSVERLLIDYPSIVDEVGAVEMAALPLKRTLNLGNLSSYRIGEAPDGQQIDAAE
eukprot:PDM68344.1 hypothetical protein PRIPAC_46388 [Pristionchus pacificus]